MKLVKYLRDQVRKVVYVITFHIKITNKWPFPSLKKRAA